MRRREGAGDMDLGPRATRLVSAVAPDDTTEQRDSAMAPRREIPADRHAGMYGTYSSVALSEPFSATAARQHVRAGRPTSPPRTLGDTAARTAAVAAAGSRSRETTSARYLRPGDTALVTATSRLLAMVEPEMEEQRALRPIPQELELATGRGSACEPVTIVAATMPPARSALVRLGAPPHPHSRARHLRMVVISATIAACLLAAVRFALPLAGGQPQVVNYTTHVPGASGNLTAPSGPWSTGSGVSETLGLGGGAAPGVKAPGSAGVPATPSQQSAAKPSSATPSPAPSGSSGVLPAPLHPWPPSNPFMYVPGHPSFGMTDVNGYYYWAFGQCTWWAQYKRQDENLTRMGSARYWAAGAASRGYRTGPSPAAGATVVFQPGVQGASGYGHVAHVVEVYPGGWFLMSEMNFYVNGGGWGRVDYRYAHAGSGVTFIY